MSIAVEIPRSLREFSQCAADLSLSANTIREALDQLSREHPQLYRSVCDETGTVRRHINIFVNSRWVPSRQLEGLATELRPGDVMTIFPAVSGG